MENVVIKNIKFTKGLVMPKEGTYLELTQDEMEYVDGGAEIRTLWWGTRIHFSTEEANALGYSLGGGYGILSLASAFLPEPVVSKALAVACFVNAFAIATAIFVCNTGSKGINLDFTWIQWWALLASPINAGITIATSVRKA